MTEAEYDEAQKELDKAYHKEDLSMDEYSRRYEALRKAYNGGREPSASHGAETIKHEEKKMSDEFDPTEPAEERVMDPKEKSFRAQVHQRNVVAAALQSGKLSCLPGPDGYADTEPAHNVTTGTHYHGATLLQLKEFQKENGFPSGEFVTFDAAAKAGVPIRKGQSGVSITFSSKNEAGEWENKTARVFNVAQTASPAALRKWAEAEKEAYQKSQYGDQYQPPAPGPRKEGPEITCTSTEPAKYLGEYLAAVSMGGKFKASPEQAAEFKKNLGEAIDAPMENGYPNPFVLSKISAAAGDRCKEVIKEVRRDQRIAHEQQQSQGRGL
jgi:hypothetical protein